MKTLSKLKIPLIVLLIALLSAGIFLFYQKDNFSPKLNQNIQQTLKTQANQQATTQAEHDRYESVYQVPLEVPYCSDNPTGGELGKSPCDATHYLHWKTYTGFQRQWNPNDSKRQCQQDISCSGDNSNLIEYALNLVSPDRSKGIVGDLFRYYIPKGTTYVALNLYGPPPGGKCATLARFGKPPETDFPSSFDPFQNTTAYPDIFPVEQYPDGRRSLFNGKSVDQLTQNDWFAVNEGGHIIVVNNGLNTSPALEEGNWLYIKFKRYDNSQIPSHKFFWGADKTIYTNWYNSFTSYDSKGDPAFGKNSTSLPGDIEPQSSPDGDVDIFDYNIFILYWSQTPVNNPADIDQNGKVDIFDYNLLVGNFGKTSNQQ